MFNRVGVKENLVDRVVGEIQNQIMAGVLKPGMLLPPERELCDQLGVSRTALREAVRMLVSKGVLEPKRHVGTVVKQVGSEQIAESLSLLMSTQNRHEALENVHQVRKMLEVEIARIAAEKATEQDIETLMSILDEMEAHAGDRARFTRLDNAFHTALARTTHNPILVILLNSIQNVMSEIRQMVESYPDLTKTVIPDHRRIAETVSSRNPADAAQAMTKHLDDARQIQLRSIEMTNGADFSLDSRQKK